MARFTHIISAIDVHTLGEPARIILNGVPLILGNSMADKRRYMQDRLDHIRTLLMQEPRGHRDMFGVILTSPTDPQAQYGALFMDTSGYIDMCVHGIIATTTVLIELGMVPVVEPETVIIFDTPAGLVRSHAKIEGHQVAEVSVINVPSFLYARDVLLQVPGIDAVMIDIAFGGNFFALLPATALHIALQPDHLPQLIRLGMLVKQAANSTLAVQHPTAQQITTVELVEIYDHPDPCKPWTKNVVIFGNGQIDRCPCGTGTSAMMATLYAKGELPLGVEWVSEGMIGTQFKGRLLQETLVGDFVAVVPLITGSAYLTGIQQFVLDPNDPLKYGFILGE